MPHKLFNEPFTISGVVATGSRRGHELGFPTANLEQLFGPVPKPGIYAGWATVLEQRYMAAVHIGPRPTFDDTTSTVEAHLLDFPEHDVYGKTMQLSLVARIRDIVSFSSRDELIAAITEDCATTRRLLASTPT